VPEDPNRTDNLTPEQRHHTMFSVHSKDTKPEMIVRRIGRTTRAKIDSSVHSNPTLILLQQEGSVALGWSGYKFWWPILAAPATVESCVFASKVAD